MKMRFLMLGPPGAGKGVISQRLAENYHIPQISTGDLIREEIEKGSEIGKFAKETIENGTLLGDEIVIKIVEKRIKEKDCKNGFIFDGFPRTLNQAEAFERISGFDIVINFLVRDETIIKRVCTRRVCEKCKRIYNVLTLKPKKEGVCDLCGGKLIQRKDDTEGVMKKRLEVYKNETFPLIEFYKLKGNLIEVDGEPSVAEVFENTLKVIKQIS